MKRFIMLIVVIVLLAIPAASLAQIDALPDAQYWILVGTCKLDTVDCSEDVIGEFFETRGTNSTSLGLLAHHYELSNLIEAANEAGAVVEFETQFGAGMSGLTVSNPDETFDVLAALSSDEALLLYELLAKYDTELADDELSAIWYRLGVQHHAHGDIEAARDAMGEVVLLAIPSHVTQAELYIEMLGE